MVQEKSLEDLYKLCHELFEYREDGELVRKVSRCGRAMKGSLVRSPNDKGYYRAYIDGKRYQVHRLIFLMHHGYLPKEVDHINRITNDNRIENLRDASRCLNMYNRNVFSNNTSGQRGVDYKETGWRARIQVNGKSEYLGLFSTKEEATKAYEERRLEIFRDVFNDIRGTGEAV